MNAADCLRLRRSCRKFTAEPVSRDILREIVELARYAPSWKNTQIARYTVIDDKSAKSELVEKCITHYPFNVKTLNRAAAMVVLSYETGLSGRSPDGSFDTDLEDGWELFDAGVAAQAFCLAAREKGVGTCIIGVFDAKAVHTALGLPENRKVACLIAVGYPEKWNDAPPRKETEELLSFL